MAELNLAVEHLVAACKEGTVEQVEALLDQVVDVDSKSVRHLDVVELLYAHGANIHYRNGNGCSALYAAAYHDHLPVCKFLLSKGADLLAESNNGNTVLGVYGAQSLHNEQYNCGPPLTTRALSRAALEAAWAAGPHPSQVQRRRDERWFRRGPLLWVLAEHAYRPLQLRVLAIALAAAELDPADAVVVQTSRMQDVLRSEGLVRYIVAFL